HMTPSNVLRAAQLIKTGETFELSHVLGRDMPFNPGRQYDVHTKRSTGPFGSNQRYSNEELVISKIGQVGAQFDGFTHQWAGIVGPWGKAHEALGMHRVARWRGCCFAARGGAHLNTQLNF